MKIAVESSALTVPKRTGVNYYIESLLNEAVKADAKNNYELFYIRLPGQKPPDIRITGENVIQKRIWWFPGKIYNLLLRTPFGIPIDILSGSRADLFLFPNYARWPLLRAKRSLVIIYDLGHIRAPETQVRRHQWYLSRIVPKAIKKSSHVITISESVKEDIIRYYGTDPEKITTIVPALDHDIYKQTDNSHISSVKKKYNIQGEYILYLGTVEPRKNIARIIRGYQNLAPETKSKYKLVIAGGKGWRDEEITNLVKEVSPNELQMTGYVDDVDKPALYAGAACFVYPSLYEGWGMQILEAMACGTPVITSNNSSMPEVAGGAAVLVNAEKTGEITSAMKKVLSNKAFSSSLRAKGYTRSAEFSWSKSARILLEVFAKKSAPKNANDL